MHHRTNLLAAAALLALTLPAVAHADDNNKKEHPAPPPHAAAPKPPPQQPHAAMQQQHPHGPPPQAHTAGPHPGGAPQHHEAMGRPPAHEGMAHPGHEGFAGGPHGHAPAAAHMEMRNQWRSGHADWADHTVWRGNSGWWRGNPAFAGYTGPRAHFFFAPGFGYYNVPSIYWGRHWGIGAFLPLFFLTYAVADYAAYGLPPPPPGAAWVWVNNNLLLINQSDGYVLDEVGNVW